jgi:hypothetical protein
MEMYRQRRDRTVILTCGAPLVRKDVIYVLEAVFGSKKSTILSVGELQPRRWEVLLADDSAVSTMLSKVSMKAGDKKISFEPLRRQPRRLRVKRMPACIPHEHISDLLRRRGIQVANVSFERDLVDGFVTNTRLLLIDTDDWGTVPDVLQWQFDGLRGLALLFLAGRPPCCHRCGDRGHQVKQCLVPYCRVCRRMGHEVSETCHNRRPTYAERAASTATPATAEHEDQADEDDGDGDGDVQVGARIGAMETQEVSQLVHDETVVNWAEATAAEQQPTGHPVSVPAAAAVDAVDVPGQSADSSSGTEDDDKEQQSDDMTDTKAVGGGEFRRPTDHVRRQLRARKRAANKSPTSAEPAPRKMSATEMQASSDVDSTVRRHSRTRVSTGRRQTERRNSSVSGK